MTAPRPLARAALGAALALLAGCALSPPEPLGCANDSDCPNAMVCFVDGCGDPGTNITLEVRPKGGAEQDFFIDPGELRPYQLIELFPTARVVGAVQRGLPDGGTEPLVSGVSLTARGTSLVTPGVDRLAGPVAPNASGNYTLPVGSGQYTLTASTSDPNIPPIIHPSVVISPGDQARVDILFPPEQSLLRLGGQVVRTVSGGELVGTPLQIEALDPATRRPLSHRVPVADGGTFAVTSLRPAFGEQLVLRVTSGEANALVPQKEFPILWGDTLPTLELGDFGEPVTATGTVLGPDGGVVAGASVVLGGPVAGGGEFRSAVATTDAQGRFSIVTLPSGATPMRLLVVPPVPGVAGVLEKDVFVSAVAPQLADARTPARVLVRGSLRRPPPEDGPAGGVQVTAEPVAEVEDRQHAGVPFQTQTQPDGTFALYLDPALYRLDFSPGEALPRVSRMVVVPPSTSTLQLEPFVLSAGRTMRGSVVMRQEYGGSPLPAAGATVRLFRLVWTDGVLGAVVLAQGVTDASGGFEVVLPSRSE